MHDASHCAPCAYKRLSFMGCKSEGGLQASVRRWVQPFGSQPPAHRRIPVGVWCGPLLLWHRWRRRRDPAVGCGQGRRESGEEVSLESRGRRWVAVGRGGLPARECVEGGCIVGRGCPVVGLSGVRPPASGWTRRDGRETHASECVRGCPPPVRGGVARPRQSERG